MKTISSVSILLVLLLVGCKTTQMRRDFNSIDQLTNLVQDSVRDWAVYVKTEEDPYKKTRAESYKERIQQAYYNYQLVATQAAANATVGWQLSPDIVDAADLVIGLVKEAIGEN